MFVTFGKRFSFVAFLYLFSCVVSVKQYGSPEGTLYVAEDERPNSRSFVINRGEEEGSHLGRSKRDASTSPPASLQKNISTWTTHLNDSHQQLMVHWVGEGSNVIICLARDSNPRTKGTISSSALFISYDYGKNFTNKTESFRLGDAPDSGYAQLDKFFNHPKHPEFCVFVDSTNKKLYFTRDNGKTIIRSDLSFHPSELAFDEEYTDKYVILDKIDSNRKLYATLDGGKTFKLIQSFVKTFFWSSGTDFAKAFYVERWKPDGTSTVLVAADPMDLLNSHKLFEDAKDFQIKGDFMFATKQSKEKNTLALYISHQRGPFFKAEFETELDLRKFHVADVTDKRIFVSVMHTETLADLYVSEINKNFTEYNFVMSLEQVLCYFPDGNWKDSWLEDVTEDPFTDLYRVEGLKGIYIASRVDSKTLVANIAPEHLVSLITYDHGVTWSPINPPTEDENGKPLNCHIENSCSLHLCQKFSQLYPVTRSASIMSSKSAPGIIMATGVMGKSLKGIPGVYISRDAGLTWKRILKDYYFFNYGDHGGVLVAVKYFKVRGETRKILYSTNEGIDWNSYQFNADDLRIYGLMTEPGENTTTFTMFGSANEQHQWIIITIDLLNTFPRKCTPEDYKFWSPSPPNSSISCVLGQRDTFQRRLAHTNCYNGIDYDRPVKKEVCECTRRDYECDYGFSLTGNECVRRDSTNTDIYAVPKDCQPGHFYKSTKGYRKIDGDVCTAVAYIPYEPDTIPCPLEDSQEFILVALRDKIARIDLADNSTVVPVSGQKNIVAIEFDIKNNCIYWADIEADKINRQCFGDGTAQEVVVGSDLASIEGMALDWISNVLFFVDGQRKKIEAIRTDLTSEGKMRATILGPDVLSKPRGIAVHPRAGYLFWTDWDRTNPSISRSNLDGTGVKRLFKRPIVRWPNGITIDQMSERIYWVDAMEDYIASADLNGYYFRRILWNDEKVSHPFAVAVLKDKMYWDDWKARSIFIADKYTGANVITINDSFSGLMDLKVFAHFTQHGSNACSYKNTSCDTLCLGAPGNTFSCLCPDGFKKRKSDGKCMCPNDMEPAPNMTCPKKPGATCDADQFTCKNGMCITASWRCDGNNDCGDLSDELGCLCIPPMISCDDTRCYLPHWRCDGDIDCVDMSDEKDCGHHNCTENQFQCGNGQCIEKKWVCDGDNDCKDGSDERNCTVLPKRPDTINCSVNGFACGNDSNALCVPNSWVCDGERDCPGGEDEKEDRCKNSTCAPYMFRCPNGKCIFKSWVCDGENDCGDDESSDEKNCTNIGQSKLIPRPPEEKPEFPTNASCLDWMFKCDNGNCLPYWWRCDRINDCGDNSDEVGCGLVIGSMTPSVAPEHDATKKKCGKHQFTCGPGVCIPLSWVCDTAEDCPNGADELNCSASSHTEHSKQCGPVEMLCPNENKCIPDERLCDGNLDCMDGSDENGCELKPEKPFTCPNEKFACDMDTQCVEQSQLCNGHRDCYDGSDEANCTSNDSNRLFQFLSYGVYQANVENTSFLVSCWMSQPKLESYRFLPSIIKFGEHTWKNASWIDGCTHRFTDLEPATIYNVTFYVQDTKTNKIYSTDKYVTTITAEGVPSPPRALAVRQLTGRRVNVQWTAPKEPRGTMQYYTLFYTPPVPPFKEKYSAALTDSNKSISVVVDGYFEPNKNYSFWVTGANGDRESEPTEVLTLTFDDIGDVDNLVNVSMRRLNDSAVYLEWHEIRGIEGYIVQLILPYVYAKRPPLKTKYTNATVTDLPPGLYMNIQVMAYKDNVIGEPLTLTVNTTGTPHEFLNLTAKLIKEKRTTVELSWNRPTSDRYKDQKLQYELHYQNAKYRRLDQDLFNTDNDTVIVTSNTTHTIEGLNSCESYIFTVGLLRGPLARYTEIITRENPKAPVKNLKVDIDKNMKITWNANCDVITEAVPYQLDILEETREKLSQYALKPMKNVTLEHLIVDVPIGGRYNVCIKASVPDSVVQCTYARGREIPAPENVIAYLFPQYGQVQVIWHHSDGSNDVPKYTYEVLVSEKEMPDDLLHVTEGIQVSAYDSSPALVTVTTTDEPLFVGVRATLNGYYSDLSEVQTIYKEEALAVAPQKAVGAVWWGVAGAAIAGVLVGGALLHVLLRHRRLSRSFLRLSAHTPRYDSRRGQATIGDHDDDDVPPIHGFSDDEPLVIA